MLMIIKIHINKDCMTEFILLDDIKVVSISNTGLTVNLISDAMVTSRPYLSSIPIFNCPDCHVCNTSQEIVASKFIEFGFKLKDDFILYISALFLADFLSVRFV